MANLINIFQYSSLRLIETVKIVIDIDVVDSAKTKILLIKFNATRQVLRKGYDASLIDCKL